MNGIIKNIFIYSFVTSSVLLFTSCFDNLLDWESSYVKPSAYTADATDITESSVTLNAKVRPNSDSAKVGFMLTDTLMDYYSLVLIKANPETFPPGTNWYSTSAKVTGLKSKKCYYFSAIILNDHTLVGFRSFKTL